MGGTGPILETRAITKRFPRVLANENVSIRLERGEILALLGENGAGKSTLMNMLYGLIQPTSGQILLDGGPVTFASPRDAIRAGLGMVHQHFMLIGNLTVAENIILGTEPTRYGLIDYRTARDDVRRLAECYQLTIDPDETIENLSVGLQQRVEILKALYRKSRILILDEPTAVLTPQEVEQLFGVIRTLRDNGLSVIIITHKLDEVTHIADRVYILRQGRIAGECRTAGVTKETLATMMVGREVVLSVIRGEHPAGESPILEVRDLRVKNDSGLEAIRGLSLTVRPGEILGIAGVDGNGQTELAEAILGTRSIQSGRILFAGSDIAAWSTHRRRKAALSFVPADRHRHGLVLPMAITENMILGDHDDPAFNRGIMMNQAAIRDFADNRIRAYDIRAAGSDVPVSQLSGGNQQKVILAREFSRKPRIILISQPTRGLDVGAIEYIHRRILDLRDRDTAVLLISLELDEIFSLSDRIAVLYGGTIVKEFTNGRTTQAEVGLFMTGGTTGTAEDGIHGA